MQKHVLIVFVVFILLSGCSSVSENSISFKPVKENEDFLNRFDNLQKKVTGQVENKDGEGNDELTLWPVDPVHPMKEAVVDRVVDGDTLLTTEGERVRLIGVNAPEMNFNDQGHPKDPEPFAEDAFNYLADILEGETVYLEYHEDEVYDTYDRLLAYVWYEDGGVMGMLNALMLYEGLAELMTIPPHDTYADTFESIERDARERGVGMWSQ